MRLKSLLILIILIGIGNSVFSQSDSAKKSEQVRDRKGFILFSLGLAVPLGDLADQNAGHSSAGLAYPGFDTKLIGGYRVHKNIGMTGFYGSQNFSFNTTKLEQYLEQSDPTTHYTVTSVSGWGLSNIMAGAYAYLPMDDEGKFIFEPRLMVGFSTARSPGLIQTVSTTSNGVTSKTTFEQLSTSALMVRSFLLGSSVKLNFGSKMCLTGSIDYTGCLSKPYFRDVTILDSDGKKVATTTFSQNFQSLCVTFGIGVRFGY